MPTDIDATLQFWSPRYAQGFVYGTEPTPVAPQIADIQCASVACLMQAAGTGRDAVFYAREGGAHSPLRLSPRIPRAAATILATMVSRQ